MKLIHQILGLILGFIIGILTTLSGLGLLGLWVYSDTKKNPPKYRGSLYHPRPGATYGSESHKSPPKERVGYPLEHVYESLSEAEGVLTSLRSLISAKGWVHLTDLNHAIGRESTMADWNYGWMDLSRARTTKTRDGYIIEFPDPVKLRK